MAAIRISGPGPDVKSGLALSCRSHRQMRERVREAEKIGHNEAVEVLLETSFERPADPSKAMNILNELIGMLGWGRLVANEGGSSGRCRKLEATEFLV